MRSGTPWGACIASPAPQTLNARFPGQWFQLESGLHYNWHRHYDPTFGRYTQPDPLGFVDGPSVYGYAGGSPARVRGSRRPRSHQRYDNSGDIRRGTYRWLHLFENHQSEQNSGNSEKSWRSGILSAATRGLHPRTAPRSSGAGEQCVQIGAVLQRQRFIGNAANKTYGELAQCVDARKRINNVCFRGNDHPASTPLQERKNALFNCIDLINKVTP